LDTLRRAGGWQGIMLKLALIGPFFIAFVVLLVNVLEPLLGIR
jgi:hypothetical protein